LQSLVANVLDPDLAPVFNASAGLCLPHFRSAVSATSTPDTLHALVSHQSDVMAGLAAELAEFIRKHDYRFTHEAVGGEGTAYLRAIALVTGRLSSDE